MNIRRWLFALLVLVLGSARADTTYVVLGTQYSGNYIPWWNYAGSMRWQTLFRQDEINRAGQIASFAFRSYDGTSCTFNNVTMKMCLTPLTTLDSSFDGNYGGNVPVTVFQSPSLTVGAPTNGWFAIPAAFDYNNRDNLLVEIAWDGASGTGAYMWTANLTPGNRRMFAYDHEASKGMPDYVSCHARLGMVNGDVGCAGIIRPVGVIDSGQVITPQAVVRNHGPLAAQFGVRFRIGDGYEDVRAVTLAPGATDSVEFNPWTAATPGHFAVSCSTELSSDTVPDNDVSRDSVFVAVVQAVAEGENQQSRLALGIGPNPAGRSVTPPVSYSLPHAGDVSLKLYDIAGRPVRAIARGYHPAGSYSCPLLPAHCSPAAGVYVLELEACGTRLVRKLVIE